MRFSHSGMVVGLVLMVVYSGAVGCFSGTCAPLNPHILYVGGSGPGNYTRIQDAVDAAVDGDTVFVYHDSSPYSENVAIRTSISLIGENRLTTILQDGTHAVYVYADYVHVSGFTITNVGDFWNCCGVYAISKDDVFDNLTIAHNERMNGIFLDGVSYSVVRDCLIEDNNYHGIRMEYASNNRILNNTIRDVRGHGIYLSESPNNVVEGNTVQRVFSIGIILGNNSYGNTVLHNNVIDNAEQAKDVQGGNFWDGGSVVGGNFWSDYTGTDANHDGIGDVPYKIHGNLSQDAFPLMHPYGLVSPIYQVSVIGGFGVSLQVKNIGSGVGENVSWNLSFSGGVRLLPLLHLKTGIIARLGTDEETVVHAAPLLLGLGSMTVSGTVGGQSFSQAGFLIVCYFMFVR